MSGCPEGATEDERIPHSHRFGPPGQDNAWLTMGRQHFRPVGAWGTPIHHLPRAALRWPWAGRGCPVGAQKCCPVKISGTQIRRPPGTTVPWVAGTKCPGGEAARGVRENVELTVGQRSMKASCRCATPTREALSGPPDVSSIGPHRRREPPPTQREFCRRRLPMRQYRRRETPPTRQAKTWAWQSVQRGK